VVLTMLVGLGEDPLHPLQDMLMVWLSVVGVGLSEFWSEIAVMEAMLGHKAYWPEVSKALRHSLWVLPAALVPTATFLMFATGQLSVATAYKLATWAMAALMFAATARTRWLAGANLFRSTVVGLVASALGYGISQLRAFVH
jgi:hypothetical protein